MRGTKWCRFVFALSVLGACRAQPAPPFASASLPVAIAPASASTSSQETPPPEPPWSGGELIDFSEGNRVELGLLATSLWEDLIAVLPKAITPAPRLVRDADASAVRLASWCSKNDPVVAVSDGFLLLVTSVIHATVYDQVFHQRTVDGLSTEMARRLDHGEGLAGLEPRHLPRSRDPRVLTRQHEQLKATFRFLFAHELAHFALGHDLCSAEAQAVREQHRDGRIGPAFSDPLEVAADEYAVRLLRDRATPEYPFRPNGALAWFHFLEAWERIGGSGIRTAFQRASLPPAFRAELIRANR